MDDQSKVSDWLGGIAQALSGACDVDDLAARFVQFARDVLVTPAGAIYVLKPHTLAVLGAATYGVSDFFLARYEDVGRDIDPLLQRVLEDGVAVDNQQLMTHQEWRDSPLYQEVLHLHRFDYIVQAPIVCTDQISGVLVFAGTSNWADRVQLRSAATAIGRIVGASLVSLRERETAERSRGQLVRALDLVNEAIVVSDARTGKRHHNRRAQRLLDELRDLGIEHFDDLISDQAAQDGVSVVAVPLPHIADGELKLSVRSTVAQDDAATTISFLTLQTGASEIPEIYSRLLSRREQDVARLVVDGLHDNDIAQQLNISQHTVKQYLKSVYRKLGVGSRVELARLILTRP